MDLSGTAELVDAVRSGVSIGLRGRSSRAVPRSGAEPEAWVAAPLGIVEFQPDEMTVRVRAGTTIEDLSAAVAEHGQFVHGSDPISGSIGGALACGRSGIHRLGRGSIRDVLLEVRLVDHGGNLVKAGGPTVKNVSGFDLCRLFVGSFGVLGFAHEFVLRTRPRPPVELWFRTHTGDPDQVAEIQRSFYRPSSILWDGRDLRLCLAGHRSDIDEQISHSRFRWEPTEAPSIPEGWVQSTIRPAEMASMVGRQPGRMIAQIGTGTIHQPEASAPRAEQPERRAIVDRLLAEFNPLRRLNPHIDTRAL